MGDCGGGVTLQFPTTHQNSDQIIKYSGRPESWAVMIFGSLEGNQSPESLSNSVDGDSYGSMDDLDVEDDLMEENASNVEENKAFWDSKEQLLQATLCRSSSIESKIRQVTKEALRELTLSGTVCACPRPVADGCRSCLRREISDRLRLAGYNSALRKSKWRSSPDIPSGEHTYLEVVERSSSKKGVVRVVIELNFRAEFEMARANEDYNRLINRLPEVFVGKAERLQALIKILCSAAKKCMKDMKIHMGPWRKHKYMQAKWFGTSDGAASLPIRPVGFSGRLPKPTASMLTFDLGQNLSVLHCSAVKVV